MSVSDINKGAPRIPASANSLAAMAGHGSSGKSFAVRIAAEIFGRVRK